jgi:hypothetical protein
MRSILIWIVIFLGVYFLLTGKFAVSDLQNDTGDKTTEIVGDNVLHNGDTLMIIDYDTWKNNFTLDDGTIMNVALANKLLIK